MQIEIKNVLTSVVESFLPKFSNEKLGLLIILDCSYDKYCEDGKGDISKRFPLYYLIQRPSNYTKVFFLDTPNHDEFRSPPSYLDVIGKKDLPWLLKSDHDSCWRSDGFNDLFSVEYDIMEKFGGYPITSDKVSIFNTIGGLSNGIHYVSLEPFRINREETRQNIIVKKTLTIKEAAELMPEKE